MKAFIEPLQELSGYEDMTKAAMQPGLVTISGCIDAQKPHMIYTLGRTRSRRLIVTFHEQKAKELYDDYRFFDPSVVYYPGKGCAVLSIGYPRKPSYRRADQCIAGNS